ncbi:MAG: hypothetical protein NT085_04470 [candidate division SR1 bacterium]|nr:hypothetical protein [candidate division SR1 bacterium]
MDKDKTKIEEEEIKKILSNSNNIEGVRKGFLEYMVSKKGFLSYAKKPYLNAVELQMVMTTTYLSDVVGVVNVFQTLTSGFRGEWYVIFLWNGIEEIYHLELSKK